MDRRFTQADWLIVIGGLLLVAASVLPWWSLQFDAGPRLTMDGYDFFLTGIVPIVVLIVITVATIIIKTDSLPLPDRLVHPYLVTAGVAGSAVLIGIRFFKNGFGGNGGSRGLGLYLAAAAVVLALIGCVMAIKDLRDPRIAIAGDVDDTEFEEPDEDPEDDDPEEDDLIRRFNTGATTGETPIQRASEPGSAPRRTPTTRQPVPRRRPARDAEPKPTTRARRRPTGPPLP